MSASIDDDVRTACNTLKAGRSISPERRAAAVAAIKRLHDKVDRINSEQFARLTRYHKEWYQTADEQVESSLVPLLESAASRLAAL